MTSKQLRRFWRNLSRSNELLLETQFEQHGLRIVGDDPV